MKKWSLFVSLVAGLGIGLVAAQITAQNRRPTESQTSSGRPDFNGIWQASNTADWDLLPHEAGPSSIAALGAAGAKPPGLGVVEGNEIPYQPAAAEKKKENGSQWLTADPAVKCYLPGVPRATYMPYPFQIIQTQDQVMIAYQFASAVRTIPIKARAAEPPIDSWMGESYGRWEGHTLVVDAKGFNDQTWFDRAGDFHSDELHVVERYTPLGRDLIQYEATIEDPKVFTRPWKISMPLYRQVEKNAQLLEFKCVEFAEEMMYGRFRKAGFK